MSVTEKFPGDNPGLFSNVGGDFASGLVVFFVALPLCLGVALASGAPLLAGIIAGIVGGVVVGFVSKSNLSVSGPAAGLTAIVLAAITELGAFNIFLCAVVVAGAVQIALGFLKAGSIADYLPSNVIEGMLAAIGIIIILKQIPHAIGFDKDYEGDLSFYESVTEGNTFSTIIKAFGAVSVGAMVIALVSVAILLTWNKIPFVKNLKLVPAPLIVVVVGILLNLVFNTYFQELAIRDEHLVKLPVAGNINEFFGQFIFPDFNGFLNYHVWIAGLTIAIVASIETLLCIEAIDRLDPHKQYTPTNHELKAQGIGNIVCGLIGGMPITSVIVRSSANVNSGARTKLSTIVHGSLLFISVAAIPFLLNLIPLSALAAILIMTGYKLAKPSVFIHMWKNGGYQFVPFVVTVFTVVFTDLLIGVGLGLGVSIIFLLRENMRVPYFFRRREHNEGNIIDIHLAQEVSFLNKAVIKNTLDKLPSGSYVILDATETMYIDHDVCEIIREFIEVKALEHGINVDTVGFDEVCDIPNTLVKQPVEVRPTLNGSSRLVFDERKPHVELLNELRGDEVAVGKGEKAVL